MENGLDLKIVEVETNLSANDLYVGRCGSCSSASSDSIDQDSASKD